MVQFFCHLVLEFVKNRVLCTILVILSLKWFLIVCLASFYSFGSKICNNHMLNTRPKIAYLTPWMNPFHKPLLTTPNYGKRAKKRSTKIKYHSTVINFRTKAFISFERSTTFMRIKKKQREIVSDNAMEAGNEKKFNVKYTTFIFITKQFFFFLCLVLCDFCG